MKEYFDLIINFWTGCRTVSGGCRECIEQQKPITKGRQSDFLKPYSLKTPKKILVNENSDFFSPDGDKWREEAWLTIKKNPQHNWFICTKWPERILKCLPKDWSAGYANVYLGISAERQSSFHQRALKLYEVPCHGRFAVLEPLLEPITVRDYMALTIENKPVKPFIWIMVGGEAGGNSRQCKVDWLQAIVAECVFMKVPVYVKQLGSIIAKELKLKSKVGDNPQDLKYPPALRYQDLPTKL